MLKWALLILLCGCGDPEEFMPGMQSRGVSMVRKAGDTPIQYVTYEADAGAGYDTIRKCSSGSTPHLECPDVEKSRHEPDGGADALPGKPIK